MANSISGFYQTLVAAASDASRTLVGTTHALDSIYLDVEPIAASIGQTISVPIPSSATANVADSGVGDPVFSDISFVTKSLVISHHAQYGFLVRDFEQFNSPEKIKAVFMDTAIKAVAEYINAQVTGLFTTGNFTTNTAIAATGSLVSVAEFLNGMGVLGDQKVPVANDPENMSLLLPSKPYTTMLGDATWTNQQIAGQKTAEFVRSTGVMPTAFGMTVKLDQQMPTTGTAPTRSFTGAYLHRYAVALAARPLPNPNQAGVDCAYVMWKGIPLRIVGSWIPTKGAYGVSVEAGFGLTVVRDYMAQLFTIAE